MSLKIIIKTDVLSFKEFLHNSFMFAKTNLSILKDEEMQGREKSIFKIFSVMKVFVHNVTYFKLGKLIN